MSSQNKRHNKFQYDISYINLKIIQDSVHATNDKRKVVCYVMFKQ